MIRFMVVRLWSLLLLEAAVGAAGYGAVVAARRLHVDRAPGAVAIGSTMILPVEPAPLEPARPELSHDVVGTFLGMKDELLMERMRHAEVVRAKLNKGGSSISFRLDFADGSRAAFKPQQINPQTVP